MKTQSILLIAVLAIGTTVGLTAALVLAIAIPFAWIWNVVPAIIFKLPALSYWQAVGLLALIVLVRVTAKGFKISLKLRDQF